MDIARWFLGENALSPRILSVGGRLGYDDDGQTPNTFITFHDYPKAPLIMEVRGLPEHAGSNEMDKYKGAQIGVVIECEGGHVLVPDYNRALAFDAQGKEIQRFEGSINHFENFIHAVRSRRQGDLNAPIIEGHLSSALCHTANISYRIGSLLAPDSIRERIKADRDALPTFNRMAEHLAANNVNLDQTPATLGAVLKMNDVNNNFVGNDFANALLARPPRQPFALRVA
jgi:hypothetical protein